jgi:3-hydroxyacyl-CoA dehydrogenase
MDLVGIDLGPHVAASMLASLPADDPYREMHQESPLIQKMIATGYTGRKGKGGFYRLDTEGGRKDKQAIDLATGEYRASVKASLASLEASKAGGPRALLEHPDKGGRFAWRMLAPTLVYALGRLPEIADDLFAVDEAMRTGFGWGMGPFELLDKVGPAWFASRLAAEGIAIPKLLAAVGNRTFYRVENGRLEQMGLDGTYKPVVRPEGVLLLADVKRLGGPVSKNSSASLWDIGDGVLCLEFTSKMNSLDEGILRMLEKAQSIIDGTKFKALVIYNEGENFSVGANLGLAIFAANIALWPAIEMSVAQGQETFQRLKQAPFPTVGAPANMALGGGCEINLHCSAVQAHAELYMGLVEVGVGVIPGWGGCKELLTRWQTAADAPKGPMPAVAKAFETISMAKVSTSADEARELFYLRPTDGVTMNRDRLLADAKAKALALVAAGYQPPAPVELVLPGPSGKVALDMAVAGFRACGAATPHDEVVSGQLATVLTGGEADPTVPVPASEISNLERQAFLALVRTPGTLARIEHMLETGKPLRN